MVLSTPSDWDAAGIKRAGGSQCLFEPQARSLRRAALRNVRSRMRAPAFLAPPRCHGNHQADQRWVAHWAAIAGEREDSLDRRAQARLIAQHPNAAREYVANTGCIGSERQIRLWRSSPTPRGGDSAGHALGDP